MMKIKIILLMNLFCLVSVAFAKIDTTLGLNTSYGTMKNEAKSIPKRDMVTTSLNVFPAWNWKDFKFGISFDGLVSKQQDKAATVSNQNLKGRGYHTGLGVNYKFLEHWSAFYKFTFFGKYTLDKDTVNGQTAYYKEPIGHNISFSRKMTFLNWDYVKDASIELGFSFMGYKRSDLDKNESDISDNKLKHKNFFLGFTYTI